MISVLNPLRDYYNLISSFFNYLISPALLFARLYIAWLFFKSGLTKIENWESTLFLFEYEYMVPVLSPELAAILATAGELILPVLLAIGLVTRLSAIGLSIINVVAVIAYLDMSQAAYNLHIVWGLVLAINVLWGAGFLSLDRKLKLA